MGDVDHESLTEDQIAAVEVEAMRDRDRATAAMCRIARGVYTGTERPIRIAREYVAQLVRERLGGRRP